MHRNLKILGRRVNSTVWAFAAIAWIVSGCGAAPGAVTLPTGDFAGLVDIGPGRTMYLECRGTGAPTVVFVSGLRFAADQWSMTKVPASTSVLDGVDQFTRACVYDRPGSARLVSNGVAFKPVVCTGCALSRLAGFRGALAR
jgi:hypothetical protein